MCALDTMKVSVSGGFQLQLLLRLERLLQSLVSVDSILPQTLSVVFEAQSQRNLKRLVYKSPSYTTNWNELLTVG